MISLLDISATTSMNSGPLFLGQTIATYSLLVIVVLLVTQVWLSHTTTRSRAKSTPASAKPLPGPLGLPVFGDMLAIGQATPHISLMNMAKKFGNIFRIRLGSRPVLVLNGYEAICKAFVKQPITFAGRPDLFSFGMIRGAYSNGSRSSVGFSTYSEKWKLHRKIAETSLRHFTAGSQVKFVERVVATEAAYLAQHIMDNNNNNNNDTKSNGVPNDHGPIHKSKDMRLNIRLATSNIICWFMFSKRHAYDDEVLLSLLDISDRFSEATGSGNPIDFLPWLKNFMTESTKQFTAMLEEFNGFVFNVINKHHEEYEEGSERDILDHLVTLGRRQDKSEMTKAGLSDKELLSTCIDYFGAGFETVATTLEWIFLYMAAHPEVQAEIQREIDDVVGRDRIPTLDDRAKMPFTEACILETQRHATVVPFAIPHNTLDDTVLEGFFVPKDTVVFANLHSAHHDAASWSDPDVFDPHRFIATDGSLDRDKKNHVIPFSVGRRRCIGSDLARIELFLFFTIFMQRFSIESGRPGVNMDSSYGLVRRAKHFDIKLVPRS